jgi:hypothetical protein
VRERMGVTRRSYVCQNYDPPVLWANLNTLTRIGKWAQLTIDLLGGRLGAPHVREGCSDRFARSVTAERERMTECDGKKYDVFLSKELVGGDGTTVLEYRVSWRCQTSPTSPVGHSNAVLEY